MKNLIIQNRMGIGDMVIFLPYVEAISKNYNNPITLLVKESSKADQYLMNNNHIEKIINLKRSNKKNDIHDGFFGFFRLINELKKYSFDQAFIFNSSLRYNLIARLSKIPEIYQYPLFSKSKQHITNVPKKFMKEKLNLEVNEDPEIQIDNLLILKTVKKFQIDKKELNILLGIGGSGPTKRIPAKTFLNVIDKLLKEKKCKFFLATGKDNEEQIILNEMLDSKFKNFCHT